MKSYLFFILSMALFFSLLWAGLGFAQDQGQGPSPERFIQDFDRDNDGQVSKDEFPGPDDHFIRFDQNQDGYLSEDEAPQGPPPSQMNSNQMGSGQMGGMGQSQMQGGQNMGQPAGNPMDQLDKNGDGKISPDEFPGPDDHFAQFDTDRSGYLDESELPKGPPPQNN